MADLDLSCLDEAALLYVETFNRAPWHDEWTPATARQRLADLLATPGAAGVTLWEGAPRDSLLVGFAVGNHEQWYSGRHFFLREMCVTPDRQREGHGSGLLAELETRIAGNAEIYLLTDLTGPAHAFYERHGFRSASRMGMMLKTMAG